MYSYIPLINRFIVDLTVDDSVTLLINDNESILLMSLRSDMDSEWLSSLDAAVVVVVAFARSVIVTGALVKTSFV